MAALVRGPIDVAGLIARASRPDCGALAVFLGTTRDHHAGRRVLGLEYEAYEPMARASLEGLEREACGRFAIAALTITHRLGPVALTEASVAVIAAAPHRGAAFDACRWAMDELKRTVPIWKKERFDDGAAEWVQGTVLSPATDEENS